MSGGEARPAATPTEPSAGGAGRALPRWSLVLVAGLHGLIFAWAGAKLPWSQWSAFALISYALAAGHLLTVVAAALRAPWLAPVWRGTSVLALAVLGWLAWELSSSASYLAGLYGSLGEGVGAGLLALVGLASLLTLPLSCWGLAATWKRSYDKGLRAAAPLLVLVWSLGALRQAEVARAEPLPLPPELEQGVPLHELLRPNTPLPAIPREGEPRGRKGRKAKLRVPSLFSATPADCVPEADASESLVVLSYLRALSDEPAAEAIAKKRSPVEPVSRCVRAAPEQLIAAVKEQLEAEALDGPIKLDFIAGVQPLASRNAILDPFALRAGLDGVCNERSCLMPWQLVALDQFIGNEPLPFVPDFRYGVSPVLLRGALGEELSEELRAWDFQQRRPGLRARLEEQGEELAPEPPDAARWRALEGLARIETRSYVVELGQDAADPRTRALVRGHAVIEELREEDWKRALELAERHIAKAQLDKGRFRYTLHPFTGEQDNKAWNLPRQAGTTLVMCELGTDAKRTQKVASRSLAYMAKHARDQGEFSVLIRRVRNADAELGPTALPTIAFARCRERVGPVHDELIAELARFLIMMQREDGGFYPKYDTANQQIVDGPEPMYAGGQAIFALSLIEKITLDDPDAAAAANMPSTQELHDTIERAIAYYTGPYWDTFVRDFFWLEENWHCLAARASLGHHRNEAYEQYCVDYMRYKARLVFDEHSRVAREFWGSYSFGNILTPVNTPAAGFGEGLAAAIAILEARGEDTRAEREQMRQVNAFLVAQQWKPEDCYACAPRRPVAGGFSESMSAAEIRIDYTQHAWAALGHGGAWVFDEGE